jgi:hypothetical protein
MIGEVKGAHLLAGGLLRGMRCPIVGGAGGTPCRIANGVCVSAPFCLLPITIRRLAVWKKSGFKHSTTADDVLCF